MLRVAAQCGPVRMFISRTVDAVIASRLSTSCVSHCRQTSYSSFCAPTSPHESAADCVRERAAPLGPSTSRRLHALIASIPASRPAPAPGEKVAMPCVREPPSVVGGEALLGEPRAVGDWGCEPAVEPSRDGRGREPSAAPPVARLARDEERSVD